MDVALNQKTATHLDFTAFLDLAAALGCVGVEPRTDLGRPVFDGIAPERAGRMARERGLRLVGLSEVHPFDDWNAQHRTAVQVLIATAQAAGAETISLIPRVDRRDDAAERAATLRHVLAEILPMLDRTGITGLIEPIGFPAASIRHQREAAAAIEALGAQDRLGIVHDTSSTPSPPTPTVLVHHIRLVHVSGVIAPGELTERHDAQRILIDPDDRTDAVNQVRRLLQAGHPGPFSYECTAPSVQDLADPSAPLGTSIAWLREAAAR